MTGRRRWLTAVVLAALTACSGDDPSGRATATTTGSPAVVSSTTVAPASTAPPTASDAAAGSAATTSTTLEGEQASVYAALAGAPIILISPTTGNGAKPLLAWEPVAGASTYDVIVNTSDGGPYWAWRGTTPQVWLGGSQTEPGPDTEGPVLTGPMLLTVIATDDSGALLAGVGPTEIAP